MSKTERHFFLERQEKQIYCVEYLPVGKKEQKTGVLLCKPIWGERIRTHRVFTNLARQLQADGYRVITCDYYGDGNSGGETCELSFDGMVNDLARLYEHILNDTVIKEVILIGLRFGANAAIAAESGMPYLKKMLLFEPVLKPMTLWKRYLRSNLTTQMAVHKKILKTREDLIKDLSNDITVNIDGFVIGRELWQSFETVSPLTVTSSFSGPVTVYAMARPGKKYADFSDVAQGYKNCKIQQLEQEFVWDGWKNHVPLPVNFLTAVRSELALD